jgi:hypothetical protein
MFSSREGPAEEMQDSPEGAVQVCAVAQVHPDGRPLGEAPGRKPAQGQALLHRRRPFHLDGHRAGLTAEPWDASSCGHGRLRGDRSLRAINCAGGVAAGPQSPELIVTLAAGLTRHDALSGRPRVAGGPQTGGEQALDAWPPDRQARARLQEGRQGRLPPPALHRI